MANTYSLDLESSLSQYAGITDNASLSITGDITIEVWVKLKQLPSSAGSNFLIIGKWSGGINQRSYLLRIDSSSDKIRFLYSHDGTTSNYISNISNTALDGDDVGVWIHIAVTADVSADSVIMYVNGSAIALTTVQIGSVSAIFDGTSDFQIGSNGGGSEFFNGLIDDVRIWNDIRTPTEIANNYQKELNGNETGLAGYWKLNGTYLDQTSNKNDLTPSGSPVFSTDVPFSVAEGVNSLYYQQI
jgi:hypothetical protein